MAGTILISETRDIKTIKKVLCHPAIYPDIGGNEPVEDYTPEEDAQYIAGYVDGEIMGLMIYNYFEGDLYCHFQVIPGFRTDYARDFARMALQIGEAKNVPIYAEIPEDYPQVISFAKEFDFEVIEKKQSNLIMRREHGIR